MRMNSEIAELCGVILGDGHLHSSYNRISIFGSLEDLDYYKDYLIPIFIKNFKIIPKLRRHKYKKSYSLVVENKKVFEFFINKIGLLRGRKINVSVPKMILFNLNLLKPFLRGLFDTDGYLKFSKQKKTINYYPRIRLNFKKTPFSLQLPDILKKLNFSFNYGVDKRNGVLCYEISGHLNLEKWMNKVGSSNSVHFTKYLIWKKFGYVKPHLSLEERKNILGIKKKIL